MASDVLSALDLDKESLNGKFVVVKELAGSDANFVINCLISKQIKSKCGVVLLAMHNSFKYYQKVGLSMGYNLNNSKDQFTCVDSFNIIENFNKNNGDSNVDLVSENKSLESLFGILKKELDCLLTKHSSICLIIDEILDFVELGFTVEEINMFIQCCRSYIEKNNNSSIALSVHTIHEDEASSVLAGLMSHMADLICEVSALKTGRSFDISGMFTVKRPLTDYSRGANSLLKLNKYHYKIFERGIKVFAPGSM